MLVFFVKFLLALSAIIVIIIVMLQRGKGGGLAGALGGAGGQSAFGTKAGDLFTKITIGVASFWIVLSILTAIFAKDLGGPGLNLAPVNSVQQVPATETPVPGKSPDKGGKSEGTSATEKGSQGSEPPARPAEKSPAKSAPTTATPAAPAAPSTTAPK